MISRVVMRTCALALVPVLLACLACDKDAKEKRLVDSVVGDAATPAVEPAPPPRAEEEAGAFPAAAFTMPERPIPKPQTMVSSSAPEELQMKASGYMAAMRAPRPDDAPVDEAFADDLIAKLKPVVLAMDKGADKARWNGVASSAQGRQIDMNMSNGCNAKAPFNAVVQRLNVPLATLLAHGVLVLRCNDTKIQCLQNVRDKDDVLCTTAPRRR